MALLAACGGREPNPTPVAAQAPSVIATLEQTPESRPPTTETFVYQHKLLVGEHGDEFDPADLAPLANKGMACDLGFSSHQYVNEPRALELGRAVRNGDELKIGKRTLVDYGQISQADARPHDAAFFYFGVLKKLDLDVVYVNLPEDTAYDLIDTKTDTAISMEGLPIDSPSGRYLVAFGRSDMNFIGIDIAERTEAGIRFVKQIETDAYPCGLKWLSDTKATFTEIRRELPQDGGPKIKPGPAFIELRGGEWIYTLATG